MCKQPTAEEFLNTEEYSSVFNDYDTHIAMIDFAKLHVEAALEEVQNKLEYYEGCNLIKDLYPLDNIK
jgi:uncharacterized protein YlzI (FlbEa/FlbD family)